MRHSKNASVVTISTYSPCIVLFLLCITLLFPIGHAAAHTLVSGNGRITGQLLNGSQKNVPLAGQTVTLQMAQDNSAHDQATSTTDAHGTYMFNNLATDKAISYALYINYQNAQYTSNIITLDSKPVQQTNLTVYDATSDTHNIAIIQSTVLIHQPETKSSSFTVSELFNFKNLSLQSFVGSLDTSEGKPKALFFSLPKDARNVSLDQGFNGYKVQQAPNGFASNAVVYPGNTAFSFTFNVPYLSAVYDFNYEALYPTVSLSFLVDPSIHASAGALNSQGIVTTQQHPYRVFTGSRLLTSQNVHINFEGLPRTASTSTPLDLKTIWLIVGLIILMAIIVVSSLVSRMKDGKVSPKSKKHTHKNNHAEHTHKKPGVTLPTSDRKEALMHEMLELDKAFEAGKLTKAVYQERRAKIKARLRTLMGERETSKK